MLPQGYTRVEYIESTGTQYIDTKVEAPGGFRAVIDVYFTKISADSGILGAYDAASPYNRNFIACNTSQWLFGAYGYAYVGAAQAGTNYTLDVNTAPGSLSLAVNGVKASFQISEDAGGRSNKSLYLLALNTGTASILSSARVGGGQIYNSNGTLVRDYIPCRNPDGEAGLYDMVGGQFYGNAGTGEFLTGRVIASEDVPDVPKALEYTLAGNIVALTWSASYGADTYRVYRGGALIVETESTEYTDTVAESPVAHVYAVTAVNEFGESALSESVRADIWGDTAPELIYDRTQADVDDAKALISKYMRGEALDGYEQEMWERGLRGCYNTSDVNRVEYHTRELQNILNSNGYNILIDTRLWSRLDIMRYSDIVRYLGNIKTILDAFGRSANTPKLPSIDRWIDYIAANDIEKILHVTRELVYGALAMFRRAGTFTAGNDYERQVIRRG